MSGTALPGNPYADVRVGSSPGSTATLALAYEQRTANLIAAFGQLMDGDGETFLGKRIDGYELAKQIQERLDVA